MRLTHSTLSVLTPLISPNVGNRIICGSGGLCSCSLKKIGKKKRKINNWEIIKLEEGKWKRKKVEKEGRKYT